MANVTIQLFGVLSELTNQTVFSLDHVNNTNEIIHKIETDFPAITKHKYIIALNNKVIKENTSLNNSDKIAIMPPYSGG